MSYLDKLHETEEMTEKISLWVPCDPPGSHGNLSKSNWWPSRWQGNHPGLSGPLSLTLILTRDDGAYHPISCTHTKRCYENWENWQFITNKHLLPMKYIPCAAGVRTANQFGLFQYLSEWEPYLHISHSDWNRPPNTLGFTRGTYCLLFSM